MKSTALSNNWSNLAPPFVSRACRQALTLKFPCPDGTDDRNDMKLQVGRTCALTSAAQLKPVFVAGVMVSSATLHNIDELKCKDLRTGDTVIVRRTGRVSPEIAKVVREHRVGDARPARCPVPSFDVQRERRHKSAGQILESLLGELSQ